MREDSDFPEDIDFELDRLIKRVAWTAEIKLALAKRPEQRRVRSTVAGCLGFGHGKEDSLGAVLLVLDELVANAYRYTTTPGELRITRQIRGVLIEVTDDDPDLESLKTRSGSGSVHGYHGLLLVTHLSLEWGARPEGNGKVVWALVPARRHDER
ncbi:ATP-binding protein [Amycolatopsis sp. NPDC089917]|uniref:ATP-binding protein n=1 Tax=Amycolatopsis sp. NPDC089917 TaxID=3155187 RepID=UPI003421D88D